MEKMSTLTFPDGTTYEVVDAEARKLIADINSSGGGDNEDTVNENLLWNADFRNVYNKSGATSYSSTGWGNNAPCINRWVLKGATGHAKLTINDNSVTVSASPETGHFRQIFGMTIPEDDYTLTINVLNLTGTVGTYSGDDTFTSEEQFLTLGKNVIHIHGSLNYVNISMRANTSIELEYMKLEQGNVATDGKISPKLTAELILFSSIQ